MKVAWVAALLALLALCEGLAMTKEGSLKKHDRKKPSLSSSTLNKEDKKEAPVLRLTGQPLVPKKDDNDMAAKNDVIAAKDDDRDVTDTTRNAVTKDEAVSLRVRQQVRDSQGEGGDGAAATLGREEVAATGIVLGDPEEKVVSLGNAQITVGDPVDTLNNIDLSAITFGTLGTLFNFGFADFGDIFANFPQITIGGFTGGDIFNALSGISFGGGGNTLFAGVLGIGAALTAGLAAILAFIVPGLQIANQILAIIAISLLGAYLAEDKGGDYYDTGYYSETGYDDSGSGYSDSGTGYSLSSGGYGSSPGVVGSGTGYSSYSDYRRSALAQAPFDGFTNLFGQHQAIAANSIDGTGLDGLFGGVPLLAAGKPVVTGRSMVSDSLVNRVGRMVSDAVEKYSNLYGKQ